MTNTKMTKLLPFILCISLLLSALTSCSTKAPEDIDTETQPVSETAETEPLISEETLGERMLADIKKKIPAYLVVGPLGVFDDKIAVYIGAGWTADMKYYDIGPYKFSFGSGGNDICIYHNFCFTSLQTAYELDLVSLDDVKVIHENYQLMSTNFVKEHLLYDENGSYSEGEEIVPEFSGILAEPYELSLSNRLDKVVEDAIKKWGEDIYIQGPIGTFDDMVAVRVISYEAMHSALNRQYKEIKVGSYEFTRVPTDDEGVSGIYIYNDSKFTDILTAAEDGLITADEVKEVNIYYRDFTNYNQDKRVGAHTLYVYQKTQ